MYLFRNGITYRCTYSPTVSDVFKTVDESMKSTQKKDFIPVLPYLPLNRLCQLAAQLVIEAEQTIEKDAEVS